MSDSANSRRVLLAGATGLVGSQILNALVADAGVSEIHVLSRRPLAFDHSKVITHIVNFSALPALPAIDEVYLALGTTIRVAGSQRAFRAVDLEANLAVAKAAVASGATRLALVSAAGANSLSTVFYNRVKGELEDALNTLPLSALVIAQPSILLGDRDALKQPLRLGEKISIPIAKLLSPLLPANYKPVHAISVAQALVKTLPSTQGTMVLNSQMLSQIGRFN
jgi:Predicted nucleoside-diphosphate-sugar epimerases